MQKLTFVPLDTEKDAHIQEFERLMRLYCRELDEHDGTTTLQSFLTRWIDSIIHLQAQAETDRHLELCFLDDEPVGFLYGKVDHPHHRGFIKPSYGYIMEFFVLPAHRRQRIGRTMYERLERLFEQDGVQRMYLTADPVTGLPFWEAMGFKRTGEVSPENSQEILEKDVKSICR